MNNIDNDILLAAAFLAIGADEEMQKWGDDAQSNFKDACNAGMDGIMGEVVQFAPIVESVWDNAHEDERDGFCGVWAYEVLEPVGAEIVRRMRDGNGLSEDTIRTFARELFLENTVEHETGEPFADDSQSDDTQARVRAYTDKLNELGIAPNGDDFNALLDIMGGARGVLPSEEGR
jgi:hypothetical protein